MFSKTVIRHGDRPVFHLNPYNSLKYNELYQKSLMYRNFLKTCGIKKGNNIVVVGKNTPNWVALMYAINSVGATFVPTFEDQQDYIKSHLLNETKPTLIFNSTSKSISKSISKSDGKISNKSTNLTDLIDLTNVTIPEINHETLIYNSFSNLDTESDIDPNGISAILYTSGTSGLPKGVPLTNSNILSNIEAIDNSAKRGLIDKVTHEDVFVSFLPWNHCYGFTCELGSIISNGASMYRNNNLEELRKDMVTYNPTIFCAVPRLFQVMHKKVNKFNTLDTLDTYPQFVKNIIKTQLFGKKIRYATVGGSAISTELLEFYKSMGLKIHQGYGSTECSPMISLNNSIEYDIKSVGKILDCNQVLIINPISDEESDIHNIQNIHNCVVGEILVNGTNVMSNYYGYDKTESFIEIDGKYWYRTGDIGYVKDDYLFITGRLKEQYKLSNGKFVNPTEVENTLLTIPEIQQVVVFGKDCESNSAIIVTNSTEQIIQLKIDSIASQLKKYEIPKKIILVKEPFTTENGLLTQKKSQKRNEIIKKYSI